MHKKRGIIYYFLFYGNRRGLPGNMWRARDPDYETKEASDVQKSLTRHQLSEASAVQTAFTRQQLSLNSLHTVECHHTTTIVYNSKKCCRCHWQDVTTEEEY